MPRVIQQNFSERKLKMFVTTFDFSLQFVFPQRLLSRRMAEKLRYFHLCLRMRKKKLICHPVFRLRRSECLHTTAWTFWTKVTHGKQKKFLRIIQRTRSDI